MFEKFIDKNFRAASLDIIVSANLIIAEYQQQGFTLTLRQLYYQFVARGLISNTQSSYNRIGSIVNNGRLAGVIDWEAIEDRTRNLQSNWHAETPKDAIAVIRKAYGIDMWENQPERVEVWIEKEALAGVIADVCNELDVPYFACRGYVSQSEQWRAYRRHAAQQPTVILHLGDHDPSGIDMTRDNDDRLALFHAYDYNISIVKRIALNMNQIKKYNPPPNPAKVTDSRFEKYLAVHGTESWELDALEPKVIVDLIRKHVAKHCDAGLWADKVDQLDDDLAALDKIIDNL